MEKGKFLTLEEASTLGENELLRRLSTDKNGLTRHEAHVRRRLYGKNIIENRKRAQIVMLFLSVVRNPLVLVLLSVSAVTFVLNEYVDATIVFLMVIMSVLLNFFQEYKAGKAAEKLKEKVTAKSDVLRDGRPHEVRTENVVTGDVLTLNAGDIIPSDARILSAKDFFVNESALTGESFPVEKNAEVLRPGNKNLTECRNIVFAGSSVVTGTATAVVYATGSYTQIGSIAKKLTGEDENDFTRGIASFSSMILKIIIVFVLFIFLVNSLLKHDVLESFFFAVAVAVGLTPEFLPMIMSVTMAKGSVAMAKRGAIVKRLTAIPTFGSMDILCTDKTGTLTQAKIRLVKYVDIFNRHSESILTYSYLTSSFQTGITSPLDEAILSYKKLDISGYRKIDELPFDFERKKMSVVVDDGTSRFLISKGAPEEILSSSTSYLAENRKRPLQDDARKTFMALYESLSRDGFRVLAVAVRAVDRERKVFEKSDEQDLTMVGFTAFLDPAKEGVKENLDRIEDLGIAIKIITGDNELVTAKICRDIDISNTGMLLGHEIAALSDEALAAKTDRISIFCRCSPLEKTRIINALKKRGHVVGYLGDGINDAASLNMADVGISVDNAVDVAKEAADIILTHKSLAELADGVIEGRKTFGNTMKYIMMGLSSNFGNMFSVLGAVLFIPFLPMLPIQILLNNFLYDISQITIPLDRVDREYIVRPKKWDIGFIRKFMFMFGPISSVFDFITYSMMFLLYKSSPSSFQTAWFMESLATQTLVIHVIRTRFMPITESTASGPVWISTLGVVAAGWLIPYLPFGKIFGFSPLPPAVVAFLGLTVLTYLLTTEIGKRYFYGKILPKTRA